MRNAVRSGEERQASGPWVGPVALRGVEGLGNVGTLRLKATVSLIEHKRGCRDVEPAVGRAFPFGHRPDGRLSGPRDEFWFPDTVLRRLREQEQPRFSSELSNAPATDQQAAVGAARAAEQAALTPTDRAAMLHGAPGPIDPSDRIA
jgi:hypothetical protein